MVLFLVFFYLFVLFCQDKDNINIFKIFIANILYIIQHTLYLLIGNRFIFIIWQNDDDFFIGNRYIFNFC